MRIISEKNPADFLGRVGPFLGRSAVENNLLLGISSGIEPGHGNDPPLLLHVEGPDGIELVAVRTPPRSLVLSRGVEESARSLAEHLASAHAPLPGVLGPRETVDSFVHAWSERTGAFGRLVRLQTLYQLGRLEPPAPVPGRFREACPEDQETLARWSLAFQDEVGVHVGVGDDASSFVRGKMLAGQLFVWDDGAPVSMAGWAARTPQAVRVNFVYTPLAERKKGYAAACVAALSEKLLDEGSATCILFADAGNPTSNRVYQRLGYRALCDFAEYEFIPAKRE